MKEHEFRKHAMCMFCDNKIGASGLPLFWRVTVERFGIDLSAVSRNTGLTMMLSGSSELAAVMGPDEDMAYKPMMESVVLTLCEACAMQNGTCMEAMIIAERREGEDGR